MAIMLSPLLARTLRQGFAFAIAGAAVLTILAPLPAAAQATLTQPTLKTVKDRGELRCGVSEGLPGFSEKDDKGNWRGLDVDLCRALAAAIFDDPAKVAFTPLSTETRFAPLVSGEIDILSRNTTWTLAREAGLRLQFAAVTYYDGQGFMLRKSRGVKSAAALDGAKICVQSATTTELNLMDYFRGNNGNYSEVSFATIPEVFKAYDEGRCDAVTSDVSQLYAERVGLKKPDDHVILTDIIAKEPLGPAVRQGDDQWLSIVKWTHYAMVAAEELGVSQKTLPDAMESDKAAIRRLLGTYAALGEALGLSNDWVARIVHHVGNYGESFERNVGAQSKLAIARGTNRLWTDGGIQYAPPFR